MKTSRIILIPGVVVGALLCFWPFWRTISINNKPVYITDPYQGVRLDPNQISNAIVQAKSGSVKDAMNLANHYYFVQSDITNAIEYLKLGAKFGSADAAFNLGQVYSSDPRVRDLKEAKYWYTVAQKLGDKIAPEKLKELKFM